VALKPWYTVVTPREDLRENRPLDASEFAVHLDHVRDGRAPADYTRPDRFFERTYLTESLLDLASQVVRRLSGIQVETSAVFNMATQFGGGKTHALTLLYHLAKNGSAASSWRGVPSILTKAKVSEAPKADCAVFVGTEFDSIAGRGGDDGTPLRKTPWGEIAYQLGGEAGFAHVERHDAEGQAPGGDVIERFLPSGPSLILIDELMNYVSRNRRTGLGSQLYSFLQNLGEVARSRPNVALAVSVPASIDVEMTPDDQGDYERLKHLLNRLGKAIVMSADAETSEIVRRRLFEWGGLPDYGRRVATEYAEWAMEHATSLPDVDPQTIRERFAASYPFHPSVLSVFERKWQALPRFQRTRGALRLLALWVSQAYAAGYKGAHRDPLIGLGTAPLDDPYFRSAMFEQLGNDRLEIPVTTDIVGSSTAHAARLDREAPDTIKKARLHRKVATAILFESNGGMTRDEATLPEIRMAVGEPDLDIANVETVVESLVDCCYFLIATPPNRFRFGTQPNLNKVLVDRRASVAEPAIDDRVRDEIQAVFKVGQANLERVYFPERSNQVPNRPALTLVVMAPEQSLAVASTRALLDTLVREYGSSGRTFKRALLFVVPDASSGLRDLARSLLAWRDIDDDADLKQRLDETQIAQLRSGLQRATRDLREAVWKAYRHLFLLGRDNALREIDLGLVTSSMAPSVAELIVNRLRQEDEITEVVGPTRLVRYWPPAVRAWSTKAARDAFYASPMLPRLLSPNAIRRTILDGVAQKLLAYVGPEINGQPEPFHFGTTLAETDIEISEEMYLLTAEEARKYVEQPRLAQIAIQPSSGYIRAGDTLTFVVSGVDQYGRPFPTDDAIWSARGGAINHSGMFTAGGEPGLASITVVVGEHEARARVGEQGVQPEARRVREVDDGGQPGDDQPPTGTPTPTLPIRWESDVPTQKWMNLYTRVLSKFTSTPGLRVRVSFELPADSTVSDAKLEEARTALRELGLDENLG
jgi:hypothetical protein